MTWSEPLGGSGVATGPTELPRIEISAVDYGHDHLNGYDRSDAPIEP